MSPRPIALAGLYRFEVHDQRTFPLHARAHLDLTTVAFLPRGPLASRRDGFHGTAFLASLARAPHYGEGKEQDPRHGPWRCARLRPADYRPVPLARLQDHLRTLIGPRGGLGPVDRTAREALESLWAHLALGATHAWRLGVPRPADPEAPPEPEHRAAPAGAGSPGGDPAGLWAEVLLVNANQRWMTQATFSGRGPASPDP